MSHDPLGKKSCFSKLVRCIFIVPSQESDQSAVRAHLGIASHLSTTPTDQDGGILLNAFPNGTTSKLAGLFSTLSLQCCESKEAVNTNF